MLHSSVSSFSAAASDDVTGPITGKRHCAKNGMFAGKENLAFVPSFASTCQVGVWTSYRYVDSRCVKVITISAISLLWRGVTVCDSNLRLLCIQSPRYQWKHYFFIRNVWLSSVSRSAALFINLNYPQSALSQHKSRCLRISTRCPSWFPSKGYSLRTKLWLHLRVGRTLWYFISPSNLNVQDLWTMKT